MVRTFVNFVWDVPIAEADEPPYAEAAVAEFVTALRAAGVNVTPPYDEQYAWGFVAWLPHLVMHCRLGFVHEKEGWLLSCEARRGWADWWRGRWREDEQTEFMAAVGRVLAADVRATEARWYTKEERDHLDRR